MDRLSGSAKLLRAMNTSAVLGYLLSRGPMTRADIRELTGLSKPTTSDVLRELVSAQLALVTGHTSGGPGPNAEIYATNPDAAYAAGISVRETPSQPEIALAVSDLAGTVRARDEITMALDVADPADALAEALRTVCRKAALDPDRVRHTQLGVPGSYDHTTDTIHYVDVPGLGRPGLVSALHHRLGTPVAVDNDVNLAAIAERRHGVAADADTFALLWLDNGLGLAIDLGGRLLRGSRGGAGEIGYVPLGLGRYGVRRTADVPGPRTEPDRDAAATDAPDLDSVLAGPAVLALSAAHGIRADSLEAAVAEGDSAFIAALADRIALAAATVVAVLDPSLVVLTGAVGRAGGARLRDAASVALRATGPFEATIASTGVADDPVLVGALDAGLDAVRDTLIRSFHESAHV
jgi:predicted NBD/HSP70 family sugar kinase